MHFNEDRKEGVRCQAKISSKFSSFYSFMHVPKKHKDPSLFLAFMACLSVLYQPCSMEKTKNLKNNTQWSVKLAILEDLLPNWPNVSLIICSP